MSEPLTPKQLVMQWFDKWNHNEFMELPISENFNHTSPFGTIEGKKAYLDLVSSNQEKFLGHEFRIHDVIGEGNRVCVRYTAMQGDFSLMSANGIIVRKV